MKALKKSLALLLTVLMLVSALPLGVFAAEETEPVTESTTETTAYESQDYYWKLDFNKATVSDTASKVFTAGKTDSAYNPYGFSVTDRLLNAYVKKRGEGDNYVTVKAPISGGSASDWTGAQIMVGKSGMPASIFNTVSFEMDFRWQGYPEDTGKYTYTAVGGFDFFRVRRYGNYTAALIYAYVRICK